MRYFTALLVVLCSLPALCNAAEIHISKPENDKLVMSPTIDVEGTGTPEGAIVTLTINGSTLNASVTAGHWRLTGLGLNVGANVIQAQIQDKMTSVLVVRGTDNIQRRPAQKVRFLWNSGTDDEIKLIAQQSLDAGLSQGQLIQFANSVKNRTVEVFRARYAGVGDIQVVSSDGNDVHTIALFSLSSGLFGSSPFDCGNRRLKEVTRVFVGTYRSQMTQPTDAAGFISGWGPMRRSDAIEVRIEDAAQAFGRTSAHELGHSLGLTGEATDSECRWMDGCDGGHNCDAFDVRFPLANRFDSGWHIMDPGPKTLNNARLSEPDPLTRAAQRKGPIFDVFAGSYLSIIHPLP